MTALHTRCSSCVVSCAEARRGSAGDRTASAVRRLLEEQFGQDATTVEAYGNVFAAAAFLYGVAVEELDVSDLNVDHANYPIVVTGRVTKRKDA